MWHRRKQKPPRGTSPAPWRGHPPQRGGQVPSPLGKVAARRADGRGGFRRKLVGFTDKCGTDENKSPLGAPLPPPGGGTLPKGEGKCLPLWDNVPGLKSFLRACLPLMREVPKGRRERKRPVFHFVPIKAETRRAANGRPYVLESEAALDNAM